MMWGLTQGLLGNRLAMALAPSPVAIGPNTYLTPKDFWKMLGIAFIVHALVIGIYALLPHEHVTDIPVRALSFKLGGADKIAAYHPTPVTTPAAPVMQAVSQESWKPSPTVPAPVVPEPLKPIAKYEAKPLPKPVPRPAEKAPRVVKVDEAMTKPAEEQLAPLPPVVAAKPQQYVREVGAAPQQPLVVPVTAQPQGNPQGAIGGQGSTTTLTNATVQAVRTKYEQDISGWIQRHKMYPPAAAGREGRVVVRMRIDRAGNVRYYAVEQSSGFAVFDEAALDMIRRANPVPAVPANYPAGNLVEFLIPISFKAP